MGLFDNGIPDFANPLDIAYINAMCDDEEEDSTPIDKFKKRINGQKVVKNNEIDDENAENDDFDDEELEFYDLMDEDEDY